MIGGTARRIWTTPPQEIWREAASAWRHGVVVLVTLTLAQIAVGVSALAAWLALNALPMLLVEGWTFDRVLAAFGWTALGWLPVACSIGARHLPPRPESA